MTLLLDKLRYLVAIYISVDGKWKIVDGNMEPIKKFSLSFFPFYMYIYTQKVLVLNKTKHLSLIRSVTDCLWKYIGFSLLLDFWFEQTDLFPYKVGNGPTIVSNSGFLFNYSFPPNFNQPYCIVSQVIEEYWNWKSISLGCHYYIKLYLLCRDPYRYSDDEYDDDDDDDVLKPTKVDIDISMSAYGNSRKYVITIILFCI